jgi:putative transposase
MPIHQARRGTYGAVRIHAELVARGGACGHNRVARLMRQAGRCGCHRRRCLVRTTRRDPAATPAPDLVQRLFSAPAPHQLWLADIAYVPAEQEGFLSLAVILDVFSRRVVGWSMRAYPHTEMVLAALEMALWSRRTPPPFPALKGPCEVARRASLAALGPFLRDIGVKPHLEASRHKADPRRLRRAPHVTLAGDQAGEREGGEAHQQ